MLLQIRNPRALPKQVHTVGREQNLRSQYTLQSAWCVTATFFILYIIHSVKYILTITRLVVFYLCLVYLYNYLYVDLYS